jgi:hypothetical protein
MSSGHPRSLLEGDKTKRSTMGTILLLLWFAFQTTHCSPLQRLPSGAPVPVGNVTSLNEQIAPAYMPSAPVRGTFDILYTCLITLTLCVYTAIHINVPPRRAGKIWWFLHKGKWTILGIFAPEVVLFTAWDQFQRAIRLRRLLNEEANKYFDYSKSRASRGSLRLIKCIC